MKNRMINQINNKVPGRSEESVGVTQRISLYIEVEYELPDQVENPLLEQA